MPACADVDTDEVHIVFEQYLCASAAVCGSNVLTAAMSILSIRDQEVCGLDPHALAILQSVHRPCASNHVFWHRQERCSAATKNQMNAGGPCGTHLQRQDIGDQDAFPRSHRLEDAATAGRLWNARCAVPLAIPSLGGTSTTLRYKVLAPAVSNRVVVPWC
jgi:hypothetical protein